MAGFVSRERYDELQGRYNALIADREILLDRIMLLSGQKPIYHTMPELAPATGNVYRDTKPQDEQAQNIPLPQRPTFDSVRAFAQNAVNQHPAAVYAEKR